MSVTIKLTDRGGAELTITGNKVAVKTYAQSPKNFVDGVARTFQTFVDTTIWTAYEPDPDLNRTNAFVQQAPYKLDIIDWDDVEQGSERGVMD